MTEEETSPLLVVKKDDIITSLPVPKRSNRDYSGGTVNLKSCDQISPHVKTYRVGEDEGRLALMAKELGLSNHRKPLKQVRAFSSKRLLEEIFSTSNFEDVEMRAVFTAHDFEQKENASDRIMLERLPSFENEEEVQPPKEIGGDLVSAVVGVIKAMVGPAILYLPHGFATAGYATAIPIMFISTCLFLFSSNCLLESWKLESTRNANESTKLLQTQKLPLSYPELAFLALGSRGEVMVKLGIALMQSGVCLTYFIFVPQNFQTITKVLLHYNLNASWFILIMLLIQIPFSWIIDIRKLTITNVFANILIMYGLLTCLGYAFEEVTLKHLVNLVPFQKHWYNFIGTSVLLFEGTITLLVPLQESILLQKERLQFQSTYQTTIKSIICFYAFFGLSCWMAFGSNARTVFTTSLPDGILATSVQLAYSTAVIFTFPLQNFPSLEITCKTFPIIPRNVLTSCMICCLAIVALLNMDRLDKVVSLMGSLLGCPIAFIFPPLIHLNLDPHLTVKRKIGNYICATLGFSAMIFASSSTLLTWHEP